MSIENLADLCDDSLYYIFDYLSNEDRISLAQVSQRFRNVFVDKYGSKYSDYTLIAASSRLELIEFCICREVVKSLTIDLDHFDTNRYFRNYGCIAPKNCFQILCHTLAGMVRLEHLSIKQLKDLVTPIKRLFDQILEPIRLLSDLKSLQIEARDDCVLNHLSQLQYLESLTLLVPKVPVATLVKCCKFNSNLRVLHLGYSCVQGSIGDIVPNCTKLEVLRFGMTAEASTYKPLARLPRLRELYHFGIRRSGSFEPLLSDLATHQQLTHLTIDGGSLTLPEATQLVRIRSLTHLKCFFFTIEPLEVLAELVNLEELCIWMSCSVDISNSLLKIIASCKNLKLLRLAAGKVNTTFFQDAIDFIKKDKETETLQPTLKLEIPNDINKQNITQEANNNIHYSYPVGRELIKWNTFNND